ncbi:hypothetical protein [Sphingomonas sp. GM_Shp_1]|uniref:hypothetical protein n=1 Tax=Sphingomonas sp. GM_Shp_1 TaxID=2937381 RepID=UPI00226BBB24|nr:hypothetical protein [Sphingomonas sp. GM_Shp_1]
MMLFMTLALIADSGIVRPSMPPLGEVPQRCVQTEKRVSRNAPSAGPRKLNEMPDAEARFAVLRSVDGCPIPAKVSQETAKR